MGSLCWWCWKAATPRLTRPEQPSCARPSALAFAFMLLFSPHYPWYVAWLIPFLVLVPSLTLMTYIGGLFYLCTTALAVGSGPKQYQLNVILYSSVLIAFLIEWTLRRLPATSRWFQRAGRLQRPSLTMPGISIIIPALNEEESIGQVVAEMPWHLIAECIVVDNGSTDRTAAIAAAAGARVIQSPRGYGAACLAGSNAALPTSDILAYMDGDGADIIAGLERLTAPIAAGEADFVIGSRIRGHREPGSMLPSQVFAGWFVGILLRLFQRVHYTDMCAFRAIRRTSLDRMHMSELTYGWNLEMQIKAAQLGLRIEEITVDYRCRLGGVSKVSGDWKASLKAATRILEVLFRVGLRRKAH